MLTAHDHQRPGQGRCSGYNSSHGLVHVAGRVIRQALRSARLSQQELADRAGQHQPGIAAIESAGHDTRVDRLERILGAVQQRIISIPTTAPSAAEVGGAAISIQYGRDAAGSTSPRQTCSSKQGLADVLHQEDEVHVVGGAGLELGHEVHVDGLGVVRLSVHQETSALPPPASRASSPTPTSRRPGRRGPKIAEAPLREVEPDLLFQLVAGARSRH